jgi:hypothetical protein
MTDRLPRPSARVEIVDNKRLPTPAHLRYFETLASRVEGLLLDLQTQIDGLKVQTIGNSYANGLTLTATAAGATATISVSAHTRVYTDATASVNSGSIAGLAYNTTYSVYYDDEDRSGGAVTYASTTNAGDAVTSATNRFRHFVGAVTTPPTSGSPPETGSGSTPPSYPGDVIYDTP